MNKPYSVEIKVKKYPKQARSKASFDAVVQACAWILMEEGYAAVTTNRIAEKAGVNIASLYEYFPNKETVVAVLAERELEKFVKAISQEMAISRQGSEAEMVGYFMHWAMRRLQEDRGLLTTLLLEVPFVPTLPAVQNVMASVVGVIQMAVGEDARVHLTDIETGAWLITRMCFNTGMEIASHRMDEARREKLIAEFSRLCFRLLFARDPSPTEIQAFATG